MKNVFLFCLLICACFCAQAQTYKSRVSETVCVEVSLQRSAGKVSFSRKIITSDKNIGSQMVNLTEIPFQNNVLTIAGNQSVWFIPFGLDLPAFRVGGAANETECWEYKCACGGVGGGSAGCEVSTANSSKSCTETSCGKCCVGFEHRINCGTKKAEVPFWGGGIFIVADEVAAD